MVLHEICPSLLTACAAAGVSVTADTVEWGPLSQFLTVVMSTLLLYIEARHVT